mmetsp:Transcript_8280/g.14657  ORF Transcript_8280/g.14657 Transcript_8280/m.14657 type:complete len:127 (-) Transcript_8280:184-564(-)
MPHGSIYAVDTNSCHLTPLRTHTCTMKIFPVVFVGSAVLLGVGLGMRTLLFSPDIKRDSRSRSSPILDNREEAIAYRNHTKSIGKWAQYGQLLGPDTLKHPCEPSKMENAPSSEPKDSAIENHASS